MSNFLEQGVLGIVTGILTTAILFVVKAFWTSKVIPFLAKTRYQGVNVAGQWSGSGKNEDPEKGDVFETEFSMFLEQTAHDLTGSFLFKFKNPLSFNQFQMIGILWNKKAFLMFRFNYSHFN